MEKFENVKKLVTKTQNIVITTHIMPDADGIGSQVALCMALRKLGKNAICVNEEPLMERYRYLDPKNVIISVSHYLEKYQDREVDLFIVVDASNQGRIGPKAATIMTQSKQFLYIDHHPCSPAIAAIHCVDTTMAATGQLVATLIQYLGVQLDQDMALALYTSILIDTSSFRYPTVTGNTHRALATLLDTGINVPYAYNQIYGTKKVSHMALVGRVLATAQTTDDESVAWIIVQEDHVLESDSEHEDTHGFINHLLILDNLKVACMFREDKDNNHVKVSFRSDGKIDVGEIAIALGGGGHNHSAATIIDGTLDEVVTDTIHKIQLILKTSGLT